MKTLSEVLGYPQFKIDKHPPASVTHKCGIYKEGQRYVPSDGSRKPKHSTSTKDSTGLTATQRKIMAVLQKAKEPMEAKQMAKAIKLGHGSASVNLTKLHKMGRVDRTLIKNGQTRWYAYVSKP